MQIFESKNTYCILVARFADLLQESEYSRFNLLEVKSALISYDYIKGVETTLLKSQERS